MKSLSHSLKILLFSITSACSSRSDLVGSSWIVSDETKEIQDLDMVLSARSVLHFDKEQARLVSKCALGPDNKMEVAVAVPIRYETGAYEILGTAEERRELKLNRGNPTKKLNDKVTLETGVRTSLNCSAGLSPMRSPYKIEGEELVVTGTAGVVRMKRAK